MQLYTVCVKMCVGWTQNISENIVLPSIGCVLLWKWRQYTCPRHW